MLKPRHSDETEIDECRCGRLEGFHGLLKRKLRHSQSHDSCAVSRVSGKARDAGVDHGCGLAEAAQHDEIKGGSNSTFFRGDLDITIARGTLKDFAKGVR